MGRPGEPFRIIICGRSDGRGARAQWPLAAQSLRRPGRESAAAIYPRRSRPGGNYHNSPRRLRAGVLPARALSGCRRRRWQSPRATTAVGSALRWSLASFLRRRLLSMTVAIPSTSTHPMGFACLPRVLPPRKGSAPTRPRIGDHSYLSSIQETGAWAGS